MANPASLNLGIPLVGVMDLVLSEVAGPIITDFKTASKSSGPLEITHEVQLSCYSFLFRHVSPEPESGLEIRSLIKTKTPKIQFHRYPARREQHFRRLFALIREYLDCLDAGRFNIRPGWGCGFCEFCGTQLPRLAGLMLVGRTNAVNSARVPPAGKGHGRGIQPGRQLREGGLI